MGVKTRIPGTWTSPASTAMFWEAMEEHARKALARQIVTARQAKGWSKEKLALEADVVTRTIRRLEKAEVDKPQAETLNKIAAALGLDVHTLDPGRPTLADLQEEGGPLERIEGMLQVLLNRLPGTPEELERELREAVQQAREQGAGTAQVARKPRRRGKAR